ncbi:MAG: leucine--tRNA ligase [Clostridiales bacterium]|nr:MAG: leucine--tRNA ligase [Clostridiales bacterium]
MKEYIPRIIEKKWQEVWDKSNLFKTQEESCGKEKKYLLIEFPYPSGQGLHVGHPRPYTGMDVLARKYRFEGYNVLFPIGFDAFGLPTENYAIKHKVHPRVATDTNIENFKRQLKSIGYSFDWDRCVDTTEESYYKWTQFLFLKFFEKGLAYKDTLSINFCTVCKVGLANEEVVNGVCDRCKGEVVKKDKMQWMLKITDYAEKLIDGLKDLDYIERAKLQQINWIGKSEGAEIKFPVEDDYLLVYTTRPDTIYGATYMVIAPEHPIIDKFSDRIKNGQDIETYKLDARKKSDFERTKLAKDKTGVKIEGISAINPITLKEIPIYVSDYVMMGYGTGAIMAVPAHDDRDYEFAKKFGIDIVQVLEGGDISSSAFTGDGKLINSELINGLNKDDAIVKMIEILEDKKIGVRKTNYKLRDWVFSRQRYWGEPIPIIHCDDCGMVAVPYEELPLTLPKVESYEPTDTGESPLANIEDFVNTTCPKCSKPAKRETDTMPQWAGSSWYFLRYIDPKNDETFAAMDKMNYWLPIDWYNGGMEHTTLHLLYSRFWHQFFYDIGLVPTKEPYAKRTSHGMILGEGGVKMSKSLGNVVNPDDVIKDFGADTLRMYEMFIGDFERAAIWSTDSVKGCRRFLDRVWQAMQFVNDSDDISGKLEVKVNQLIEKVSSDYENLKFNTAIAKMMEFVNDIYSNKSVTRAEYRILLQLLNPIAPHITEELWEMMGNNKSMHETSWPKYDKSKLVDAEKEIAVQINGKVKATINIPTGADKNKIEEIAMNSEKILELISGKKVVKVIVIPDKIVNIVVK